MIYYTLFLCSVLSGNCHMVADALPFQSAAACEQHIDENYGLLVRKKNSQFLVLGTTNWYECMGRAS